jgi:putative permease
MVISYRRENIIRLACVMGILFALVLVMLKVENMLVTQVLAWVLFYTINPLVNRLERAGFSRLVSIIVPFVACGFFIWLGTVMLSPMIGSQVSSFRTEFPKYIAGVSKLLSTSEEHINSILNGSYNVNISAAVENYLLKFTSDVFTKLPNIASSLFTVLLLAPFFAFFMLKDGRQFSRQLLSIVPNNLFELSLNLVHQLNSQLGDFIRARFLEALIVGALVWAGLQILGYDYAVVLGVIAGVTNLIPYIGPVIGAVPAFLIALVNEASGASFLTLTLIYVIAQVIDMLFIVPILVAKIVDLHPITVVVAIIIGSQLMGILGMIISIPIASAFKVIATAIFSHMVEFKS